MSPGLISTAASVTTVLGLLGLLAALIYSFASKKDAYNAKAVELLIQAGIEPGKVKDIDKETAKELIMAHTALTNNVIDKLLVPEKKNTIYTLLILSGVLLLLGIGGIIYKTQASDSTEEKLLQGNSKANAITGTVKVGDKREQGVRVLFAGTPIVVETNSNGDFTLPLDNVQPTADSFYNVRLIIENTIDTVIKLAPGWTEINLPAKSRTAIDTESNPIIVEDTQFVISGIVKQKISGEPVGSATVHFPHNRLTTTGDNGEFEYKYKGRIFEENFHITVTHPDFQNQRYKIGMEQTDALVELEKRQ